MRRFVRLLMLLGCSVGTVTLSAVPLHAQSKRVALVIGNSEYKHTGRLENPKNDAADMAAALDQLGFKVVRGIDLDKSSMERTIRDFAESMSGARVALLFYAGHGLQVAGQNYLVPVDAKLTTAAGLDFEMVRLDLVHRAMEREATTNIIILDACRDNPLARNLARALGTRSSQVGRGLATVESGEGTLISFSTQPGNVALDGTGRNSPFASALLKHIATPGNDLPTILINVRNDVMAATERRQVPWEHSAMTARFYFTDAQASADQEGEIKLWDSVKDSSDPAQVENYLRSYPQGTFAVVARNLIAALEKQKDMEKLALRNEAQRRADLHKVQEEVRKAQEVAKSAGATKKAGGTQIASVPDASVAGEWDGNWRFVRDSPSCRMRTEEFVLSVRGSRLTAAMGSGSVSNSGEFSFSGANQQGGEFLYSGRLAGNSGKGTYSFHMPRSGVKCSGTVVVTKLPPS